MKKDIVIPEVKDVYVVALYEWNNDFNTNTWFVYLVNDTDVALEMPFVVSHAHGIINGEERKSASLRHSYPESSPYTAIRLEMILPDLLELNNIFMVTYFVNGKLFDKKFVFPAHSINENTQAMLPVIQLKGIIAN